MDHYLGEFKLLNMICSDDEKDSYIAHHVVSNTPYIVQVIKKEGVAKDQNSVEVIENLITVHEKKTLESTSFSASKLNGYNLVSFYDYINSCSECLDPIELVNLLAQMATLLDRYYLDQKSLPFGLYLDNCFIDETKKVVLIQHSDPMISSFRSLLNQGSKLEDVSMIAFGKIAYFLMTKQWPEGYFPLPTEVNLKLGKKWDDLIKGCLHHRPELRIGSFSEVLERLEALKDQVLKPVLNPTHLERPEFDLNPAHVFQQELALTKYSPEEKVFEPIEPLLNEMVLIPEGDYLRGSSTGARDEMPKHKIHLSAFALDIHPVTNEQFIRFLEAMGGEKDAQNNDMIKLKDSRIKKVASKFMIETGYHQHPVVGISWYGAQAYAKWVGKRLPTEAEWEIAASSLQERIYPTGESLEKGMAHFFASDTVPVMSFPPSPLGLYDMAGNVYEWCQDWYSYDYYETSKQEPINPLGPHQGVYRVLRGGCWKSLKEDLRVSHRHRNNPFAVNSTYGFRCAADVS
jgi:formylglycine-generating enzyme required for sulfatase activity